MHVHNMTLGIHSMLLKTREHCNYSKTQFLTFPLREAEILTPQSKALERQAPSHIEGRTAHGYKP